jgi:hypothetical protein
MNYFLNFLMKILPELLPELLREVPEMKKPAPGGSEGGLNLSLLVVRA